ncbi:vanadium-dependent haloperoxidase [Phytohabitans rumicis]
MSDLSLQRRSLLLGGAGGAAALVFGLPGAAAADSSAALAAPAFDFDTDIALNLMFPPDESIRDSSSLKFFAPMDVTLFIWFTQSTVIAWFDAVAPYHPTAVGVHTRIPRRPASESTTNRNMNIAIFHASYQVLKSAVPDQAPLFGQVMASVGLNPNDESVDPTTPVGIGNLAGRGAAAARTRDGMNILGDIGRRYNPQPFADYTGYRPVNTAFKLTNPSRWQPQLTPHRRRLGAGVGDKGIYTIQHFVTPQMRLAKPYSYKSPAQFRLAPPDHTDHHRRRDYKRSVDEMLEASASLTDKQKAMAEFFDNKLIGIGQPPAVVARKRNLDLHSWVHLLTIHNTAVYDALVAVWHQKAKYDAVRPFSAIRHVYGSRRLTAWGGPGKGTVHDIRADEWASYLNVGDHPEYPSGSTTLCSAEAQAVRRFFGDDVLDWRFPIPAGWTLVEPGITPANNIELHWPTWTDLVQDCGISRVWGGVHFRKTIERSIEFGGQCGDLAYEFMQRYISGDAED